MPLPSFAQFHLKEDYAGKKSICVSKNHIHIHESSVGDLFMIILRCIGECKGEKLGALLEMIDTFLIWIGENKVTFCMLINLQNAKGVTTEWIKRLYELFQRHRQVILTHLVGTVVLMNDRAIQIVINTALSIFPPMKPLRVIMQENSRSKSAEQLSRGSSVNESPPNLLANPGGITECGIPQRDMSKVSEEFESMYAIYNKK